MKTITINIEDSFYPHFVALLESLEKDKKVEIVKDAFSHEPIIKNIEEIQEEVEKEEEKVAEGNFLTEDKLLKIREDSSSTKF